jgi:hypothetical protein
LIHHTRRPDVGGRRLRAFSSIESSFVWHTGHWARWCLRSSWALRRLASTSASWRCDPGEDRSISLRRYSSFNIWARTCNRVHPNSRIGVLLKADSLDRQIEAQQTEKMYRFYCFGTSLNAPVYRKG